MKDYIAFWDMAYNNKGYIQRAKMIQEVAAQHYEPENQAKCYKAVWRKQIFLQYGVCYRTFLRYLKVGIKPEDKPESKNGTHYQSKQDNAIRKSLNSI